MKSLKFILPLTLVAMAFACSNSNQGDTTNNNLGPAPTPIDPTNVLPPPVPDQPAVSAAGVYHYTCPNGCAGGAGSEQPCANCGTTLAHNQAYHAQQQATTPTTPQAAPAGVFHYTCPNGCAGGAAQAQACATCGTMLAHNQAYHNAAPAAGGATAAPGGKSPLYINNN